MDEQTQEAEVQPKKSKREELMERLRGKHEGLDLDDEEVRAGRIYDDYDEYDKRIAAYEDDRKKVTDIFVGDPRKAEYFMDLAEGKDPVLALIERYGIEIRDALDDPQKQEEIAQKNEEYLQRVAKNKELDEQFEKNFAESTKSIDQMRESEGLSGEDIDKAIALIMGITYDTLDGVFKPETIKLALKAINHDKDVAGADERGEVRGRNTRIKEQLRKAKEGDNVPVLGGANGQQGGENPNSIFSIAKGAR